MEHTPRLLVTNDTDRPLDLVLEPWGEEHPLPPGTEKTVLYLDASTEQYFSVVVEQTRIQVWADGEGPGTLEVSDTRRSHRDAVPLERGENFAYGT